LSLSAQKPNQGPPNESGPPPKDEEVKEVEIINSDVLHFEQHDDKKLTKLKGNVVLKQDQMLMYCDSASLDKDENKLEAWGHVHIQSDTVNAYSDYLNYDSKIKLLILREHAYLTDSKAKIVSEEIYYRTKDKVAYYLTGGKVYRAKSIITSQYGYYHTKTAEVYFNKSVDIIDPDYHLTSDTLKYNTSTDVATFFGNTTIYNKSSRIFCDNGWFDTKTNIGSFGVHTRIYDGSQILKADSLYFERTIGYGQAYRHFQWKDTAMDFELQGKRGQYTEELSKVKAFEKAFMIYRMDNDSLFMSADTLRSQYISMTDTTRIFLAYHHMKMYMHQMQGACDSMKYSFADSTFRMYYKPIIWADTSQLTGDTIFLTVKNRKADKLFLRSNAFVIMPSGKKYYDQIKGKNIYGYFLDNALDRMYVEGNSESIYYGKDEKNKYLGANKAQCVNMWMYFKDKKVKSVTFLQKPDAVFLPMKMLTEADKKLKNFNWQIGRKPLSREEIMWLVERKEEPASPEAPVVNKQKAKTATHQ
jgi:lipopolysaccharide export system protein LptA